MEASTIALIILAAALILYITEIFPIAVTSIAACLALAIFGVVPIGQAFRGFGSDMVYLMGGMIVVGNALFETGVAQALGKKIVQLVGGSEKKFVIVLILIATVPAAFLSNTAAAAMMLPLVASVVAASGGRIKKRNTFMIIGMAATVSGGFTVVGSPPQVMAQRFLVENGHEAMAFFELSWVGVPILALLIIYYLTIGQKIQKKAFDFEEPQDGALGSSGPGQEIDLSAIPPSKKYIIVGILLFCIVGFITELWTLGVVAMVGASLCVITRCISLKRLYQTMDWTTLVVIGGSIGLSIGMEDSGAGFVIANAVVDALGDAITPWLLCAVLVLISILLTNFMSNTASAALLIPIAGAMAIVLGFDVKPVLLAVVIGANISYATPIATPPITMTLVAGYRFKDYVRYGGLFTIFAYILVVLLFPVVFL